MDLIIPFSINVDIRLKISSRKILNKLKIRWIARTPPKIIIGNTIEGLDGSFF